MQLNSWNKHTEIASFNTVKHPDSCFIIDLEQDSRPIPYSKFNSGSAMNSHRLIDTTTLAKLVKDLRKQLEGGKKLDDSVRLSAFYAKPILHQLALSWGPHAVRNSPRDKGVGHVHITCGINGIYYYLNGRREFESPENRGDEGVLTDVGDYQGTGTATGKAAEYILDQWDLVDQGPGGFAISRAESPPVPIRVGDLIGIIRTQGSDITADNLALGVIRWLMISGTKVYRVGIQTIAADILPAAIRSRTGSIMETRFNRAIIAGDFSASADNVIITAAGMYAKDRVYELQVAGKTLRARVQSPVESTVNFDHFVLLPD